jgi:hypothetical protein
MKHARELNVLIQLLENYAYKAFEENIGADIPTLNRIITELKLLSKRLENEWN